MPALKEYNVERVQEVNSDFCLFQGSTSFHGDSQLLGTFVLRLEAGVYMTHLLVFRFLYEHEDGTDYHIYRSYMFNGSSKYAFQFDIVEACSDKGMFRVEDYDDLEMMVGAAIEDYLDNK